MKRWIPGIVAVALLALAPAAFAQDTPQPQTEVKKPSVQTTTTRGPLLRDLPIIGNLFTLHPPIVERRVPLLSDLPIIGNLFTHREPTPVREEPK